jgi:hypothetical protein
MHFNTTRGQTTGADVTDLMEYVEPNGLASVGAKLNSVLVGTDGSPSSSDAVGFAVQLAFEHQSWLHVVHVIPTVGVARSTARGDLDSAFCHESSG